MKAVRKSNYRWAKAQVAMPRFNQLNKNSKTIDLVQVPKKDKTGKTKVQLWSYKANGPGSRFMLLSDGKGSIKQIWGPYSPKTYDGDFLKLRKNELSGLMKGCTAVADCHFAWARPRGTIKDVRFLVPYSKPGKKRKLPDDQQDQDLDPLQQNYNQLVRNVRARVESPFGLMKRRFTALEGPFGEDETQLKYLVHFAAVVENKRASQ